MDSEHTGVSYGIKGKVLQHLAESGRSGSNSQDQTALWRNAVSVTGSSHF